MILDLVLALRVVAGHLGWTVFILQLPLAFLEWALLLSVVVSEIIAEPCLAGMTIM